MQNNTERTSLFIRTRSVTPLNGRITINRTIGIKTPPRNKKPLSALRSVRSSSLKEALHLTKAEPCSVAELPISSVPLPIEAKTRRGSSVDAKATRRRMEKPAVKSKMTANRLIKRQTRELKAQRRRDKYRELFLRQQALALERLARVSAAPQSSSETNNCRRPEDGGTDTDRNELDATDNKEQEDKDDGVKDEKEKDKVPSKVRASKKMKKRREEEKVKEEEEQKVEEKLITKSVAREGEDGETVPEVASVSSDLLVSAMLESAPTDQEVSLCRSRLAVPEGDTGVAGDQPVAQVLPKSAVEDEEKRKKSLWVKKSLDRSDEGSSAAVKETEIAAVAAAPPPFTKRRKSSTLSSRLPRIIQSPPGKSYSVRILGSSDKRPVAAKPDPFPRFGFTDLDRDERDLGTILREAQPTSEDAAAPPSRTAISQARRAGEPTFEEPAPSLFSVGSAAWLVELVRQMRRHSRIVHQRTAFLRRSANVLVRKSYWTPSKNMDEGRSPYSSVFLAPDQIRLVFCSFKKIFLSN